MNKFYIFLLLCMQSLVCVADTQFEVGTIVKTYHFDRSKDYNEDNKSILLTVNDTYQLIVFNNSYYNDTVAVGYKVNWEITSYAQFNTAFGAVYGYGLNEDGKYDDARIYGKRILPMIVPGITFRFDNFSTSTHYFGTAVIQTVGYRF